MPTDSLNFSLDLFRVSDPLTSLGNFTDATGTVLAFSYLNLAAGDYFFRISGERMPAEIVEALAWVKRASAAVNESLGVLTAEKARAISQAADEVLA